MATPKEKILVVDDDPNLRKTLSDILRVKGYEVVTAGTGAEAVAAAGREKFSVALIDLVLPDMQGIQVMTRIKSIFPLTEAIILTGHASMDTAIEATRQGAFSYMLKPYAMDDLLQNIRHAAERKQAQEEIVRLASFPNLLPSPVIELGRGGEVTYLNPAAAKLFPTLGELKQSHPLLAGSVDTISALRNGTQQGDVVNEARFERASYELHFSYVPGSDLIRIYVLDITERKRAEEEIHTLATTDSLTAITNRREFNAILDKEIARTRRYGGNLSLIMYDLDHFKRVNDAYGHDVGDTVLQDMARIVKMSVREVDTVARWGGEEFMILTPQLDLEGARSVAERLRVEIANHVFGQVGTVTVSIGVAMLEDGDDAKTLLQRVDDALYRAKQNGRNRVEAIARAATKQRRTGG